jgi:GT2 family glycosyltransferase
MITVFYCTRESSKKYQEHIKEKSGLKDIQIIEFVNNGSVSLAKAYNQGLEQAKYDDIVFIHDDLVLSKNWGRKTHKYLNESDYGIIGIAGTTTLPKSGMWWDNRFEMVGRVWHQQTIQDGKKKKTVKYESKYSERFPNQIVPTVIVDGLFIAVKRDRIVEKFDENFDGFHFYDIPFCVNNIANGVKIGVVTDIKVIHKSIGQVNQQWHQNREVFAKRYEQVLPLAINGDNLIIFNDGIEIENPPSVAVIIPSKDNWGYLEKCITSIKEKTQKSIQEVTTIYIADTGSAHKATIKTKIEEILNDSSLSFKFIEYDYYNFAKINNDVVKNHIGDEELLLFCNDDIELLNDALSYMISIYLKKQKKVGTIGARLYYPNGRIQHGGVTLYHVRKNNSVTVGHKGIYSAYGASYNTECNVFANTGALLMVNRDLFERVKCFHETDDCLEDIILSISMIIRKKQNIFVGEAVALHHESISRKKEGDYNQKIQHDFTKYLMPIITRYSKQLTPHVVVV